MNIKTNDVVQDLINDISLKITGSGVAECSTDWHGSSNFPPYSRLYFILDGGGTVDTEYGSITLKPNCVYLLPRKVQLEFYCMDYMKQLYFHINVYNKSGFDMLLGMDKILNCELEDGDEQKLLALYDSQSLFGAMELKSVIMKYILRFFSKIDDSSYINIHYCNNVGRAIEIIEENPRIDLKCAYVAKKLFISEQTLIKQFKKEVGIPMGKYIDQIVMYNALAMVEKTELSIGEISDKFGFCDQFYFSRKFKEKFGLYPTKHRELKTFL